MEAFPARSFLGASPGPRFPPSLKRPQVKNLSKARGQLADARLKMLKKSKAVGPDKLMMKKLKVRRTVGPTLIKLRQRKEELRRGTEEIGREKKQLDALKKQLDLEEENVDEAIASHGGKYRRELKRQAIETMYKHARSDEDKEDAARLLQQLERWRRF